jgi:hypothetical protein
MDEIILSNPTATKLEYYVKAQIGEYKDIIAFDCLLDQQRVEITYPDESELLQYLNLNQLEELKVELWRNTKLQELFKKISAMNLKQVNSTFKVLLDKDRD